jgi:hypothetical protein
MCRHGLLFLGERNRRRWWRFLGDYLTVHHCGWRRGNVTCG